MLELFSFTPTDKDTAMYWQTFFIPQELGILLTNRYPIGNIRHFYDVVKREMRLWQEQGNFIRQLAEEKDMLQVSRSEFVGAEFCLERDQ